jgi:N-acetyl sugar amidotransferase
MKQAKSVMSNQHEVKYGLQPEVKYCKKCVMSNQKPNTSVEHRNKDISRTYINFDEEGVCAACRYNEIKNNIDWGERERKLKDLLDKYRKNDGSYDVIVPASGGKDSVFAAYTLKHKYGMHPLTVTWAPHIYRMVGWENLQRMIHKGQLDNILYTPNGRVHRYLTRLAFINQLHPFQPFVFGQKNVGPRMSVAFNVPLVMYGESNIEYGDPGDSDDEVMSTERYASEMNSDEIFLGGVSVSELIINHNIELNDLKPFLPINTESVVKTGTKVHYLGHYLTWDPQECYYFAVDKVGFEAAEERSEGTYSKYTELDDKLPPINFYTMHVKFGIGRAMYDASQEIRNNKITRDEGMALVYKFDGEYPRLYFKETLDYLGMTKEEFDATCDSFRSPHLWEKENNRWMLRHPVE